jgi:hypothetical protein
VTTDEIEQILADNLTLPTGATVFEAVQLLAQAEEVKARGRSTSTEPRSIRINCEILRDVDWLRANLSEPGALITQAALVNLILRVGAQALRKNVAEDLLAGAEDRANFIIQHAHYLKPLQRQLLRKALAEKAVQPKFNSKPQRQQNRKAK